MKNFKVIILILYILLTSFVISSCQMNDKLQKNTSSHQNLSKDEIIDPELKRNRELWAQNNVCEYKMELEVDYLDAMYWGIPPVEVEVKNDVVTKVKTLTEKEPLEVYPYKKRNEQFYTVERLFEFNKTYAGRVREHLNDSNVQIKSENFEVFYDSKLGYPKKMIYTDGAVDHGYIEVKVFNLEVLNQENPCPAIQRNSIDYIEETKGI